MLLETGGVHSFEQAARFAALNVAHTRSTGSGQVVECAVISFRFSLNVLARRSTSNFACKPHVGLFLQVLATPTKVQVLQVEYPRAISFLVTIEKQVPARRRRFGQKTQPEEPVMMQVKCACQPHPDSHRGLFRRCEAVVGFS